MGVGLRGGGLGTSVGSTLDVCTCDQRPGMIREARVPRVPGKMEFCQPDAPVRHWPLQLQVTAGRSELRQHWQSTQ